MVLFPYFVLGLSPSFQCSNFSTHCTPSQQPSCTSAPSHLHGATPPVPFPMHACHAPCLLACLYLPSCRTLLCCHCCLSNLYTSQLTPAMPSPCPQHLLIPKIRLKNLSFLELSSHHLIPSGTNTQGVA